MPVFDLSVTLLDDSERTTTKKYKVFDAVDYAGALSLAALFVTDLAGITQCGVVSYALTTVVPVGGAVTANSNLDAGATFSLFIGGVPGKKGTNKVPAPVFSIIAAGGAIDMTDVIVTDYAANFTSGFVLVSDGETVDSFIKGKLDR